MINCIIIDDDPVSINTIKHFVANTEGLILLDSINNPIEAVNYIRKNIATIDLIFLDVEMPDMTGIQLLESFKDLPSVILITSKEKYAFKAFEHKVVDYLVKPVEYAKFLKAVERVFETNDGLTNLRLDYLFIKEEGVLSKLPHKDILYFEALGDNVKVHTKAKVHVITATMKSIEEKLKHNKNFVRIHRSYIINLNYLENFDSETSIVAGRIIPLGNKYKAIIQSRLNIL